MRVRHTNDPFAPFLLRFQRLPRGRRGASPLCTGCRGSSLTATAASHGGPVQPIDRVIRRNGLFLRRRDLLPLGYTDRAIAAALAEKRVFRVRQGWYSVPDAPEAAIRAVRVGGRLTGVSALESYGLPVPRVPALQVAVKATASRLRDPLDRRRPLVAGAALTFWRDTGGGGSAWRVSPADALLAVLRSTSRNVAVACCGAALHRRLVSERSLDAVFARAPRRVQGWRTLVSPYDESHGETDFRLWMSDAGLSCEQQVEIDGVGRLDFRVAPHTYVEIDGGQHDPAWSGGTASSWANDLERAAALAIRGDRVLHFGYRQLNTAWPTVLAAIERAIADDAALAAHRRRHPFRPRPRRKRRRNATKAPP